MNNKQDFNNFFPTDNSSRTNVHYDIVASKFMTGIENHQRSKQNSSESLILVKAFIQFGLGIILFGFALLRHIYFKLK